ncbi:MAG: FHA domain-containing protein [Hyphomicrobium sp.]
MRLSTADYIRRSFACSPARHILAATVVLGLTVSAAHADYAMTTFGDGAVIALPLGQSWTGFTDWLAASYAKAPALVLGLAALFVIPPLALIGLWASRREAEVTVVSEAQTQVRRVARAKAEPRDGVRTGHIPLRPLEAWVELVNANEVAPSSKEQRFNLARTLLRIGRETDNDICLEDVTVHRYHAAIHRTEDAEFVITDLSSAGGNGVVVNGRAVAEARLASGDLIELGNARLKFSAAPPG